MIFIQNLSVIQSLIFVVKIREIYSTLKSADKYTIMLKNTNLKINLIEHLFNDNNNRK